MVQPTKQYTTCLRIHTTIDARNEAHLRELVAKAAGDIENFAGVEIDDRVEYTYTAPFADPDTGEEIGELGDGVVAATK